MEEVIKCQISSALIAAKRENMTKNAAAQGADILCMNCRMIGINF